MLGRAGESEPVVGPHPHVPSLGDQHPDEQERRVQYLVMTRAQDELILTRTLQQRGATVFHGGRTAIHSKNGQACFLDSIPAKLVQHDVPSPDPGYDDEAIVPFR